jgi:diadenosine tetraphosphate (Ap4A) HIT family hydrolase
VNETIRKFGHPATLVRELAHWVVLLRPKQPTLGSLILACKDEAKTFPAITPAAFAELGRATREIEATLASLFRYDKINYLMLMMVDPDVHFHVIPRYASERAVGGVRFVDTGWPKVPDLGHEHALTDDVFTVLRATIADSWVGARD